MTVLVNEHGERQEKVLVAVPVGGEEVKARFAQDLSLMFAYTTFVKPGLEVSLAMVQGSILPRSRAALVKYALDRHATHILWLDSDMRFPKDTLLRLLSHAKPVVAAGYATRIAPIIPVTLGLDRQPVFAEQDDLFEARTCGMGLMLTETDVLEKIGKPYFAFGYNRGLDDYSGEDAYFCERARQEGYAIWIDGPLTEHVKHLGGFEYDMGHARMTLAAVQQQET